MPESFVLEKLFPHPTSSMRRSVLFGIIADMKYLSGEVEPEVARAALADKYSNEEVFSAAVDELLAGVAELFPPAQSVGKQVEVLTSTVSVSFEDISNGLKEILGKVKNNDESN